MDMAAIDDLVMLAAAVAIAAAVIVGLMVVLYAWALRRRHQLDEGSDEEGETTEYPPDGRFDI